MKSEYNFSQGERGKFFKPGLKISLPVYLEPDTYSFVETIAEKRQLDISTVVNDLIKTDMQIADIIK